MKQRHRQPVRGTDRHKCGTCAGLHPHLSGTNGTHTFRCVPCAGGAMGFKSLSLTPPSAPDSTIEPKDNTSITKPITEALHDLDRAWRMYHSTMPFEDWCKVVHPDVAAYAVKKYSSLFGMYNDARFWAFKLLLMAIRQADELRDARHQPNGKQQ